MIDRSHDLPIARQAKILNISRSNVYYEPRPISAEDLTSMRWIDELHLNYPFADSRMELWAKVGDGVMRRGGVS
jgi:putative transposase